MSYKLEDVRFMLKNDQRWLERAIVVLYQHQTADEQNVERTKWLNGVGFNAPDARKLSYFARYIQSGKHLSGNHLHKAHKLVPKYAQQILDIINSKITENER